MFFFFCHTDAGCLLNSYHQSFALDWVLLCLNLNIIHFFKFKLLRVAILKRKVTIFRANCCDLKASKFDAWGKLTKKTMTIKNSFIFFLFLQLVTKWPSSSVFVLHEINSGNVLSFFGWTHCLYLCMPFLTLKVHKNPKVENWQVFRLSNLKM